MEEKHSAGRPRTAGYLLTAALAFAADQVLKQYTEENLSYPDSRPVLGGKVLLTKYHNRGAALNLMEDKKEGLLAVSGVMSGCALAWFVLSLKKGRAAEKLALALITGGAASNLADRIRKGYVVDYFRFSFLRRIVLNLADLCIFLGSILFGICRLKE